MGITMKREEFLRLFEKQLQGTITPEEEICLSAWFQQQQLDGLSEWDEQKLGNKKELGDAIHSNIQQQSRKQNIFQSYRPWLKIAASVVLLSTVAVLWYKLKPHNGIKTETFSVSYIEAKAEYGQVLKITLADSSTVWLNAGSRLRYPEKFDGKTRELNLEGEGFFEVKHRKSQPFIVHSGTLNTQVLGTSFNVKAYKNSVQLKVSVATGKVAIYTDKIKSIYLTPNQTGTYDKTIGHIGIGQNQIKEVTAWREGKLVYRNELLSQALEDITNKYGVKVMASSKMKTCQIYGTFNHDNVESLLQMISYSVNGKVIKKGSGFYITGRGCN
jgi:transmembrane sensor